MRLIGSLELHNFPRHSCAGRNLTLEKTIFSNHKDSRHFSIVFQNSGMTFLLYLEMAKGGYVYIVSNKNRTVLYIGVSSNLSARSWEHKNGEGSTFSSKYNCTDLIYYEFFGTIEEAIDREKQLKKWKREWKENLIKEKNPTFRDLYNEVRDLI